MFHTKQDVDRHVIGIFKNMNSEAEKNLKCYRIAKHYYAVNEYKSAINYINRYLSANSNSAAAHKLLGECYLHLNMKVKALDAFKASLEYDGGQKDLVLKVCELLADPEISLQSHKASYWLERAETYFSKNPIVFKLKEHLLKLKSGSENVNAQLGKLIMAEVSSNPADVTIRIRLLNFFMESKQIQVAYDHALELEERGLFYNDLRWYHCLCNLMDEYEKSSENAVDDFPDFAFYVKKITFLERRADLSMQEFQIECKPPVECTTAVFELDQGLEICSKIKVPEKAGEFFKGFMKHMSAQLAFHMSTILFKRAKKEYGIWQKTVSSVSPLLLLASQNTTFPQEDSRNQWCGISKTQTELWNQAAALRLSQAGHVLHALSGGKCQEKRTRFLMKVSQFCGGKWRNRVHADVFYNVKHQQVPATSYFLNNASFSEIPFQMLSEEELLPFDELSQHAYPESLHHLVWLGLVSFKQDGELRDSFRCNVLPNLQFTVDNLMNTGPETLNQLDVDAFLYASVLCAKLNMTSNTNTDKPSLLPVSLSEDLCTPAQADWWNAVHKVYKNKGTENTSEVRMKLRKGIGTVRVTGHHGLHVKLIVLLAKMFQKRAESCTSAEKVQGLEARSYLYWTAALPLLEKMEKNQEIRLVPNRLFDYRGKEMSTNEVKDSLEDGRLFSACRLMKLGEHEAAIEELELLKSPYATYYQGLIYKKLASEVINERPECVTSDNRAQNVILLTKSRDAFFLTLERLRSPGVDYSHPLNSQLLVHLEDVESQLAKIDTDSGKNRNGDVDTDESDAGGCQVYSDVDNSFNSHNNSGLLSVMNDSIQQNISRSFGTKQSITRIESKPSLERLDAHMRHIVSATKNELKEIKAVIQKGLIGEVRLLRNEMKEIRVGFNDMLCELKKLNKNDTTSSARRESDLLGCSPAHNSDDLAQMSAHYRNYLNFANYHHIPTCQASTNVGYGTPIVPPGSNLLAAPTVPTPLLPSTFFPPQRPMAPTPLPPTDPLLFYQGLGCFTPGGVLPYGDSPNLSGHRNFGPQKPLFLPGNTPADIMTSGIMTPTGSKTQIPTSVPSSLDALSTLVQGVGPMGTTPLHNLVSNSGSITAAAPTTTIRTPPAVATNIKKPSPQDHAFQISIPQQTKPDKTMTPPLSWPPVQFPSGPVSASRPGSSSTPLKSQASPGEGDTLPSPSASKENESLKSNDSHGEGDADPRPDFKPVIPLPDEVQVVTGEENETKLFESRAKLFVLADKKWAERGVGQMKVLHNKDTNQVRIVMRRDQVLKVCANHHILPEMELKPSVRDESMLIWVANDYSDEECVKRQFLVRFKTYDEARDFEYAFNKGKEIVTAERSRKSDENESATTTTDTSAAAAAKTVDAKESESEICPSCGNKYKGVTERCPACKEEKEKEKATDKPKFGGFVVKDLSEVKFAAPKTESPKTESSETGKPNPFSQFTFGASAPPKFGDVDLSTAKPILTGDTSFASIAASGVVGDAFKKSGDFKEFEGTGSLVFGYLQDKGKSGKKKEGKEDGGEEEEGEGAGNEGSDFVPTAEFAPVIPLPDLVETKTGEEDEEVLFEERVKILRFDTDTKEWKERGVGKMKVLLNADTGKVRLLMRREFVLKVCCNHFLDEKMNFQKMALSARALTWCAQDYSEGTLKNELFALKFGKEETMNTFSRVIEDNQKKMVNGRIGSGTVKAIEETATKPLSELFKAPAGSWECESCYVRNKAETDVCPSCGVPRGGSAEGVKEEKSIFNAGLFSNPCLPSKFTFGIPQQSDGMQFGSNVFSAFSSKDKPESSFGKFNFGIPQGGVGLMTTTTSSVAEAPGAKTQESDFSFGSSAPYNFDFSVKGSFTTPGKTSDSKDPNSIRISETDANAKSADTSVKLLDKTMTPPVSWPPVQFPSGPVSASRPGSSSTPLKSQASPGEGDTLPSPSASKENESLKSNDSHGEGDADPRPDFKPVIPLPDEVQVVTGEENETKLFESRAKLFVLADKKWAERGVGQMKVLHNKDTNQVRIVMRRDQVLKVCANHHILPEMELKPSVRDESMLIWVANDYSDEECVKRQFLVRFKTYDEARDFEYAFNKGKEIVTAERSRKSDQKEEESATTTDTSAAAAAKSVDAKESESEICPSCGNKYKGVTERCPACKEEKEKEKATDKPKFGGFVVRDLSEVKFAAPKAESPKTESSETGKPNPFSQFTFGASAPPKFGDVDLSTAKPILTGDTSFASIAASGVVGDAFKKSGDFKEFEGTGSLVFGYLQDKGKSGKKKEGKEDGGEEEEGEGVGNEGSDFVPTAEFAPVIPLPDLVETKTGEEDEEVLFEERVKILRFDTDTKEWKERGVGKMKVLLNADTGKVRLLMRREFVLKVCCNHFLDEKMNFQKMALSTRALTWCAQDYSEGTLKNELFALKFGKEETMNTFSRVIEDNQKKMVNGRIGSGTVKAIEGTATKPLSELFKAPAGSWECESCYVRNKAETEVCPSCGVPRGGSAEGVKEEKMGFNAGLFSNPCLPSKFTFGIPQQSDGMQFGSNVFSAFSSKDKPESSFGKFNFGIPQGGVGLMTTTTTTSSVAEAPGAKTQESAVFGTATSKEKSLGINASGSESVDASACLVDEEISVIYEAKVSEEDRKKATMLKLPPNFFRYQNAPACPGCIGCDKEDTQASESPADAFKFSVKEPEPPKNSTTGSWGSFKFDPTNIGQSSGFRFTFGNIQKAEPRANIFATENVSNLENDDELEDEEVDEEDEEIEELEEEEEENEEEGDGDADGDVDGDVDGDGDGDEDEDDEDEEEGEIYDEDDDDDDEVGEVNDENEEDGDANDDDEDDDNFEAGQEETGENGNEEEEDEEADEELGDNKCLSEPKLVLEKDNVIFQKWHAYKKKFVAKEKFPKLELRKTSSNEYALKLSGSSSGDTFEANLSPECFSNFQNEQKKCVLKVKDTTVAITFQTEEDLNDFAEIFDPGEDFQSSKS